MGKKISFFTSPIGLGHASRDAAIAPHLTGANVTTTFTTGGAAARLLGETEGTVQDVYNPPRFNVDYTTGRLKEPSRWLWSYYRYYRDCKDISQKIITSESPDLVVSDEDFASIAVAQEMGIKTVLITDILQTRLAKRWPWTAIESKMNASMCSMVEKCGAVIMPEHGSSTGNIFRVGPITREIHNTRDDLRNEHGMKNTTVLITVGGTDAGIFLIKKALHAIHAINCRGTHIDAIVIAGPSIPRDAVAPHLIPGARVIKYSGNMHELILAADVIVALAGRSTIDEAHAAGTPAVFIPIAGHFEQEQNAAKCGFAASDADRLYDIIESKASERRRPAGVHSGAADAAGIILSHIS